MLSLYLFTSKYFNAMHVDLRDKYNCTPLHFAVLNMYHFLANNIVKINALKVFWLWVQTRMPKTVMVRLQFILQCKDILKWILKDKMTKHLISMKRLRALLKSYCLMVQIEIFKRDLILTKLTVNNQRRAKILHLYNYWHIFKKIFLKMSI